VSWCVWLQRNDKVFDNGSLDVAALVDHIRFLTDQWCSATLMDRLSLYGAYALVLGLGHGCGS
jgi:hypothetical protein